MYIAIIATFFVFGLIVYKLFLDHIIFKEMLIYFQIYFCIYSYVQLLKIYILVLIHCFLPQMLARLFLKFLQRKILPAKKVNRCTSTPSSLICYYLVFKDVSKWNIELLMLQ